MPERSPLTEPPDGDVLGDDRPRSRRRRLVVGVLLAVVAVGAGVVELRERRADDDRERRLRSVVALDYTPRFRAVLEDDREDGREDGRTDRTLRWSYGLRNSGPRDVVVVRAALGPLVSDREVAVPAGEDARLLLRLALPCDGPPALGPAPATVQLVVRTAGGDERAVQLPGDVDEDALSVAGDRACGYAQVGEAVAQDVGTAAVGPRRFVVPVIYTNTGRRPASLVRLSGGSGMRVRPKDLAGRDRALPLLLPAASDTRTGPAVALLLEITVTDCGALVVLGAPGTGQDVPTALSASVADLSGPGRGGEGMLLGDLPNTAVRQLLADSCRTAD